MSNPISNHTKSFIVLFCIAFFGAFLALLVSWQMDYSKKLFSEGDYQVVSYSPKTKASLKNEPQIRVDTSDWVEYYNETYGLKFKHKPDWKVRSVNNRDGYYVIEVDPGARYDNFKIFISQDDYFALSGVPLQKTQIAGKEALSLEGMVLGVRDNASYFTFDIGASLSLKPYFTALMDTVAFANPDKSD